MMKRRFLIIVLLLLLAVIACGGGTGGSVTGSRESCQVVSGTGTCVGSYNRLSGIYTHKIETEFYQEGDLVDIDALFSVESGRMKISFEGPDGMVVTAEVAPGSPASLSGMAVVDSFTQENFIPIKMEALNGNVEGISYTIDFRYP